MVDHATTALTALLLACLAASVGWCAGPGNDGPLPKVRAEHPRILVTAGDMARVKRQAAAYPEEWERMKGAALWPPSDPGYGSARAIRTAALVYLVTGEEQYLQNVVAHAENMGARPREDRYAAPEVIFGLCLAYDWCYQDLSAEQRSEIADTILHLADWLDKEVWRHSDFNNHFVLEKVWPFALAGLTLRGDVADPRADDLLARAERYLRGNLVPAATLMAGETGGQFEGYGYDTWGYARPLTYILEAWRTATGEDLFPSCTATRTFALWNLYGRRPHDGRQEHFDDAGLGHAWGAEDTYVYLLAARYQDGHAQWMGDQMPRKYDSALWQTVLWRDLSLSPEPPDGLPTARRFEPLGWVLMRSDWGDEATFASFQCGPFYTGHQHLDNNAFTIHKRGLLAIDSGINAYGERIDDGYRTNYYSRTVAHNSMLVFDPTEIFSGGPWAGGSGPAANDGGQLRLTNPERVSEVTPGNRWEVGRIAAYEHDSRYTYAVGDATASYSPDKLSRFLRHVLYLPPDLLVVFDHVTATDASFRKTWLLHTVNEPAVEGAVATVTEGEGRLVCRTVLPDDATLTLVGGEGKQCWVDGKNWPSQEKPEWPPEAGAWRLEVSPSVPSAEDLFLHVIQVGEDEIAAPAAVTKVVEGGQVGVRILAQGREYTITFSTSGAPEAHLCIRDGGSVVLEEDLPS